jgi:hypothetical protein
LICLSSPGGAVVSRSEYVLCCHSPNTSTNAHPRTHTRRTQATPNTQTHAHTRLHTHTHTHAHTHDPRHDTLHASHYTNNPHFTLHTRRYVQKLLVSPSQDLQPVLTFIWSKVLQFDPSCCKQLLQKGGLEVFLVRMKAFVASNAAFERFIKRLRSEGGARGACRHHHGCPAQQTHTPQQQQPQTDADADGSEQQRRHQHQQPRYYGGGGGGGFGSSSTGSSSSSSSSSSFTSYGGSSANLRDRSVSGNRSASSLQFGGDPDWQYGAAYADGAAGGGAASAKKTVRAPR